MYFNSNRVSKPLKPQLVVAMKEPLLASFYVL